MLPGTTDLELAEQLLRIAHDPELRRTLHERLGDYCHRCRNQLNSLKLSLYLAIKQTPAARASLWTEIDRCYQELESRVDQIQTLCRPMTLSRVTLGLDLLIEDRREQWSHVMISQGRTLEFVAPAERAVASFDVQRMGQALDSLVAWRAGEGASSLPVRMRWWAEAGFAHLVWEEPLESTTRLPESRAESRSRTWALPLIARVAEAHEGDCRVQDDQPWRIEISWPSRPPSL